MPSVWQRLAAVLSLLVLCCGAVAETLSSWRWQHRVLIIDARNDAQLRDVQQAAQYHAQALAERKLIILIHHDRNWQAISGSVIPDDIERARVVDHAALIGLDGGVKYHVPTDSLDFDSIFAVIDRMPMRRAELNADTPQAH